MRKYFYLLILILFYIPISKSLSAQESFSEIEDTLTVNNLIDLGNNQLAYDLIEAKKYFVKAEKLSSKIGYRKGLAKSLYLQGLVNNKLDILDSAYYYFNSSLFINRRIDNKLGIANCLIELALYNQKTGDYAEAIRNYFRSLDILLNNPDSLSIARTYHNLGSLYLELNKNKTALDYAKRALIIEKQLNDTLLIGSSYFNIGQILFNLDSLQSSKKYFDKSFELSTITKNELVLAKTLLGQARILDLNSEFETANSKYIEAIAYFDKTANSDQLAWAYFYYSKHYLLKNNIEKANEVILQSYKISNKLSDLNLKKAILKNLQEINTQLGNFENALDNSEELKNIEEQLKIPEALQYLAINEAELSFKLKEEKIKLEHEKELNKQKTTKLIFIGSSVFALAVIILILLILIEKNKHNKVLKKANDTRDKMFRLIAHDFRSPLISISNTVHLIPYKIKAKDYDSINGLISNVTHSVNRVLTLIDNLINWALSQHDNIPYKPEKYNLLDISKDIVEIYNDVASYKNIKIENQVQENIQIYADKNILNTVLRNLINNAIKFTPENGQIEIKTSVNGEHVTISIVDNGIGIDKERLAKIFEVEKSKTEGTEGEKGNGLGLFFCKEFVKKNKGDIWVESEINKGSTFSFTIPLHNN
jgi:two-component system sensor histidine kinase/response regulator